MDSVEYIRNWGGGGIESTFFKKDYANDHT